MADEFDFDAAYAAAQAGQSGDAIFDLSHDGLALGMGRQWQTDARHVALWSKWLFWTGARWEPDERLIHMTRCRDYLRRRADDLVRNSTKIWPDLSPDRAKAQAEAIAKQLRSEPMRANVCSMARSNAELVATVAQWDAGRSLLGTPDGTVDLHTGELREARPGDFITKLTSAAPAPPGTSASIWQAFLERVFRHDPELVPFMQRAIGYTLLDEIRDHVVLFCWGQGGNGKGVLLNTVSHILGDYAAVGAQDLLLATNSDRHPCDMAMLRGARMVTCQELGPNRAWDEPKLKSLTGGDPISARFMRQDFFTYMPQFTLWVAGNHKPSFRGVDEAIKRRVLLVPFLQVIPQAERDVELPAKLRAEWPAILRWMIEGCLAYQREGLNPPESALAATKSYLDAEDTLGQWIEERCVGHPKIDWTALKSLYADWSAWCGERGLRAGDARSLSRRLDERGLERTKTMHGAGFRGIGLAHPGPSQASYDANDGSSDITRMGAREGDGVYYGADRHHRHKGETEAPDDEAAPDDLEFYE
jgi:P4 family phage/plasmid primase-like protien